MIAWVRELDELQVDQWHAELTNEILGCADRAGRPREMMLWPGLPPALSPIPWSGFSDGRATGRFRSDAEGAARRSAGRLSQRAGPA